MSNGNVSFPGEFKKESLRESFITSVGEQFSAARFNQNRKGLFPPFVLNCVHAVYSSGALMSSVNAQMYLPAGTICEKAANASAFKDTHTLYS